MSTRRYTVLLDGAAGLSTQELADQLQQHGFVVEQQLEEIGVLIGRVDENHIESIRALPGVAAVEIERAVGPS